MFVKEKLILVVDDASRIRRLLKMYLEKEGYWIHEAADGETALQLLSTETYDLVVLDIMLPGLDGIEVCSRLRLHQLTPVILLSANGNEEKRIQGFKAGADDYVVKPFSPREMIFRVTAILNRYSSLNLPTFHDPKSVDLIFPHLIIESEAHRVKAGGREIMLTPMEFKLLHYLASRPDKVFTRDTLLREVWNNESTTDLRTVDTHVKRIREKLYKASPMAGQMLTTIWGVGYKIKVVSDT